MKRLKELEICGGHWFWSTIEELKQMQFNDNKKVVNKLRKLMIGKTISKIELATADNGICKFIMDDGKEIQICATELGAWLN
jgi:hypothetical protein